MSGDTMWQLKMIKGNLIICGSKHLTAVIDGHGTMSVPINYLLDELTKDRSGNIWVANRGDQVMEFSVHPETPEKYLQPKRHYEKEFKGIDIRSANFDSSGSLWIGSRARGLFRTSFYNNKLSLIQFTKKDGLSDNFNAYLACDASNNIWSCSPSGLDKISFSRNKFTCCQCHRAAQSFWKGKQDHFQAGYCVGPNRIRRNSKDRDWKKNIRKLCSKLASCIHEERA